MDSKIVFIILMCFIGLKYVISVEAVNCSMPLTSDANSSFPDVLGSAKAYKFSLEINFAEKNKSMYVTEYYDELTSRGKLFVEYEGDLTQVLYFESTDEVFFIKNDVCESTALSNLTESYFNQKFPVWNWVDLDVEQPILGPSNMFRKGFIAWKNKQIGLETEQEVVRGMLTNVWTNCFKDNENEVESKFYFIDPIQEHPRGLENVSVPVRITARGVWAGSEINQNYEFVGMELWLPNERDTFALPVQAGCKRGWQMQKVIPSYVGKDLYLEAEVIYRPPFDFSNFTYVSDITLSLDSLSKHVAFQMTPWTKIKGGETGPGNDRFKVYDLTRGFVYDVDKTLDECQITKTLLDTPDIIFPDGHRLSLLAPDLFITNQAPKDFHYLGEGVERAIVASIYEKTVDSKDGVNQKVVTRYHLSDKVTLLHENSEPNAPLRIIYTDLNLDDFDSEDKFSGTVDINFYAFRSRLTKKGEKFDVTSCFPETKDSKWFQLVFPTNGVSVRDVIPYIQDNFHDLLNEPIVDSPLRLPKVKVDVDPDNLYVTALLLQRPPYILDFTSENQTTLKSKKNTKSVGISTLEDCAKKCLLYSDCFVFSYCGAICTIGSEDGTDKPVVEKNMNCTLFRVGENKRNAILSMEEVSGDISKAMGPLSNIKLKPFKDNDLEFVAKTFKDNIAFGKEGKILKPEEDYGERLITYRVGHKFDVTVANEAGTNMGRVPLVRCSKTCLTSATCQSLSYCLETSQCYLSAQHGQEIPEEHIVEDTQCEILTRSYADYFEEYPGVILSRKAFVELDASNVEACAKACLKREGMDCLSFDFCPYPEKDDKKCLLHKAHLLDVTEPNDVKGGSVCGHYSKKHSSDFRQLWHKELTGSEGVAISEVNVESCAKMCSEGSTCKGFNHCIDYTDFSTSCVIKTGNSQSTRDSMTCTAFLKK